MHRPQRKISERNPAKVHQEHTRRDFADRLRRLFYQMYRRGILAGCGVQCSWLTSGLAIHSGQ
jgi:hypothetical protein